MSYATEEISAETSLDVTYPESFARSEVLLGMAAVTCSIVIVCRFMVESLDWFTVKEPFATPFTYMVTLESYTGSLRIALTALGS